MNDKFTAVKLPDIFAPRHALVNRFNSESDKRVIFVSAPAGYGKTISTQLWLANSGHVPLWIGLDEYDNTPSIFYKLFCTGVSLLQPDNEAMPNVLTSSYFNSSPVEHAIQLLAEFLPDNRRYAIILDDMHLVTNEEIRKSGLLVQKRLPSSFIVVILTRNKIAEKYISAIGEEKCAVITAQDLAFSTEEIQNYFNAHGRFITAEEAMEAHAITNGWAIGINAVIMSGQMRPKQDGHMILGNYIKTQIWDNWDYDLKNFMLKTSVVDEMSPELCLKLTDNENAHGILDDLCARNAFISKFTDDTYRYHRLFLDFLRNTLEQSDETAMKTLYKEASNYYLEKGEYFQARRFAIKSMDSESIVNANYALYNAGKSVSIDEYVNFYKNFFKENIPESVRRQHPDIYCQYAWYYFLIGNAEKAEYYMDMIYQNLEIIAQNHPQSIENAILVSVIDPRVSFAKGIERIRSFPLISNWSDKLQALSISMQLPYAHRTLRDYYELADEKILEKLAGSFGLLLKNQCDIVILEIHSGFLYERNLLKQALEYALRTRSEISNKANDEVIFCSFIHLAAIYAAAGEKNLLTDVLNETEQFIMSGSYYFNPNFEAFKTKLLLMNSDTVAAKAWLDYYYVIETEQLELYKIFRHFTTARAYMVLAKTDTAMSYIAKLKKLGTDFHRPLDVAEASILQAVLEWGIGDKKEALDTLDEALTSMQEYGFVRVFADEGAAVLPILKKLSLNVKKDSYEGALDPHFLNEVTIAAYEQSKRYKGIAVNIRSQKSVKLSKQQKYMIILLSKGYKNAEIVELTGLTIHTVKSHKAAAYAKLDVNTAMDAVLKARELGLIE